MGVTSQVPPSTPLPPLDGLPPPPDVPPLDGLPPEPDFPPLFVLPPDAGAPPEPGLPPEPPPSGVDGAEVESPQAATTSERKRERRSDVAWVRSSRFSERSEPAGGGGGSGRVSEPRGAKAPREQDAPA